MGSLASNTMEGGEESDSWKFGLCFICLGILFVMGMGVFSLMFYGIRGDSVCLDPPMPDHGVLLFARNVNGSILEGAIAEYQCKQGYRLVGPSRKICMISGDWEPEENIFCAIDT